MPDLPFYLLSFLESFGGWNSSLEIERAFPRLLQDLHLPGVSTRIDPRLIQEILKGLLSQRKVVCKMGLPMRPFFLSWKEFEAQSQSGGNPCPPWTRIRGTIGSGDLELARGFNRMVDEALAEGRPLPDPWDPEWICRLQRQKCGLDTTGSSLEREFFNRLGISPR